MSQFQEILRPSVIPAKSAKVSGPPGFDRENVQKKNASVTVQKPDEETLNELKVKKAWEVALAPAKQIPMNLIMSYMTGNSLQVIPIMMTLMLLWKPLQSIFTETNSMFKQFKTEGNESDILLTKAVFVLCQLGSMGVGVWKLNKMGLIPNSESDWLAWQNIVQVKESVSII